MGLPLMTISRERKEKEMAEVEGRTCRHVGIHESLVGLEMAISLLERLVTRAEGVEDNQPPPPFNLPSLVGFLATTGQRVDVLHKRVAEAVESLQAILFGDGN